MNPIQTERTPTTTSEPISIDRDYEVRYWARTLHCTEIELKEAVRAVGTDVEEVRRRLGPRTQTSA
ncbi:hypothetical protein RD110_23385 [Rhodoferax koreense]|uniref:DUF3606 domain-containing protein n=1 Tax=Rhodoferax koreensis TaxID=1842727 RepID=A0A1P8K1A7_9BURK|nr:DUF3606 domain-containing protein [Rhodoferax koreense]APW39779.1 hypothetical protein RD110_23385 [Rhodoferax koreense]